MQEPTSRECPCGGSFVDVQVWWPEGYGAQNKAIERVCRMCGARLTKSGKFIPPGGWALPGVPVHVIVWENGNVMIFDGLGQQVTLLQFTLDDSVAGRAVAVELDRIFARERWEWRIYPGNARGIATEHWLAGRAAWLQRHFGDKAPVEEARAIAEMEAGQGELLIGANVTWRTGGVWRYGTGEQDGPVRPAGQEH